MWAVVFLCFAAFGAICAAPSPQKAAAPGSPNKSAFVPAFDEIVVESSLTVKGRSGPTSPTQREGRAKLLVVPTPGTPLETGNSTSSTTTSTSTTTTTTTTTTAATTTAKS